MYIHSGLFQIGGEQKAVCCLDLCEDIVCSKTHLGGISNEQTIICRQFFAGDKVESWSMKDEKQEKNALNDVRHLSAFTECC